MKVEEIRAKAGELKTKLAEIKTFWETNKSVDLKDFTDEQKQTVDRLNKEAQELNDEIEEAKGYEATQAKQDLMRSMLKQPMGRPEYANSEPEKTGFKSEGRRFVESNQIKSWIENELNLKGPGANLPDGIKIHSPQVEVKGLVLTSNTSGGAFVRRDYDDNVELPLRIPSIRDVITVGRTGSNLVEYVRQTGKTRAAAVVPEATATSSTGYDNAAKPESGLTYEIVQAGVKTIAVWMPITRQILADAPQLESEIDGFEREDLELALEEEIISGTGGTHFTGLENTTGITPQAFATDLLTTTRKARTTAMVVGRAKSTGFLLNPYDWEEIDLTKAATTGIFYFGGPTIMGVEQLWGLPVIQSEVIPKGTGYTGNLKLMRLWDREQATRRITDSHADFFTHNLIAILTELRAAFGVKRPAGIVKMDLFSGANS